MKTITVKAAGMFTPQEEGDCKLTIIIPKENKDAQDFAFTKLRYQDVVIGLASEQEPQAPPAPVDVIGRIRLIQEQFDGIKADIVTLKRDAEVPRPCGATQPSGELGLDP